MKQYISKELKRCNYLLSEIDAAYHRMAFKLGVSDSVMQILYAICNYGDNCPLQDICKLSGLSKQTVNSAIRKLEAEGIIYLEFIGAKNKKVCLTEAGKRLAEHTALRVIGVENEIFASWPQEEVAEYLGLMERFLNEFQEKTKSLER